MARCGFTKDDGRPCERIVKASQTYCYSHDPKRASERKRNATRGGKAKASGEIGEIKAELHDAIEAVQTRKMDKGVGAVVFQGYGMLLRAVSVGLDVQERLELIGRVEELEEALQRRKDVARWGA
jgi:hypothetical protein